MEQFCKKLIQYLILAITQAKLKKKWNYVGKVIHNA